MNHIGDYALIGDCHTAALVGIDGAVDWACFPRFDSPSVFARMLDARRGGSFQVRPHGVRRAYRAYLEDTNVLVTTFECDTGTLELTDCMPLVQPDPRDPTGVVARDSILRRLRCVRGVVAVGIAIAPRFEYAAMVPLFHLTSATTARVIGGADCLWVSATQRLDWQSEAVSGGWRLAEGDSEWIEVAWTPSNVSRAAAEPSREVLQRRLDDTTAFWQSWMRRCTYSGEHASEVRRSALVLKALQYAPTGAIVAAPTTSLPESIGGERNWDYRYTWIRDATLTLTSLFVLGFTHEADAFKSWLEKASAGRPRDLQIMYSIRGHRLLPEFTLDHLDGHRDSRPVRVGNDAARQTQLDVYGQILQAAYLYTRADGELTRRDWAFLADLAEVVSERWDLPDQGIWEVRGPPRHFTHSKLNCWMALDRAVRLARERGLPGPTARWEGARDHVTEFLLHDAAPDGWFRQAADVDAVDAATLLVPASGFLPATHPLVQRTIHMVREHLEHDGLVHRYRTDDGLAGDEGAFLLCSFWLIDCLVHAGLDQEAETLLRRMLGLANDVGLLAEEADQRTGAALGNFPQAFTHMALVTSCGHLSAARRGEIAYGRAVDYAEEALVRRLRATGRMPGVAGI
jgi:GH15 family glucan-1,4-alpha-glucosidase